MKIYGQLENACLENLASDPASSVAGRIYFNTVAGKAVFDDGTNKFALFREVTAPASGVGQFRGRMENFTTLARPAAGNAGRVIYDTTLSALLYDSGAAWAQVSPTSAVTTKTTSYTLTSTDFCVRMDSTSAALTATLPAVATVAVGTRYVIKNVGTGGFKVTVAANGVETIDGANTQVLNSNQAQEAVTVSNNGTSWDIF